MEQSEHGEKQQEINSRGRNHIEPYILFLGLQLLQSEMRSHLVLQTKSTGNALGWKRITLFRTDHNGQGYKQRNQLGDKCNKPDEVAWDLQCLCNTLVSKFPVHHLPFCLLLQTHFIPLAFKYYSTGYSPFGSSNLPILGALHMLLYLLQLSPA